MCRRSTRCSTKPPTPLSRFDALAPSPSGGGLGWGQGAPRFLFDTPVRFATSPHPGLPPEGEGARHNPLTPNSLNKVVPC
ncbi:MAG: hypothetical protein C0443_14155 [Comamonadaceae bacterium]|nr:hypothetical protein [Comamonadaceae bacterium]